MDQSQHLLSYRFLFLSSTSNTDKLNPLYWSRGRKFLVNFILFLIMVHVKLTAIYISYLLFSSCYQIFAGAVLLGDVLIFFFFSPCCERVSQ